VRGEELLRTAELVIRRIEARRPGHSALKGKSNVPSLVKSFLLKEQKRIHDKLGVATALVYRAAAAMGDHLSLRKLPQLVGYDKSAHSLNKVMRRVQQDLDTHSSPVYSSRDTGDVCVEGTSEDTSVMDGPFAHVACLLDRQRAHRLRQVVDAIVARDIGTGRQPQTILATVIALMSAQGHLKPYIPLDESCQTAGISEATVLGFLTAEGKRLMALVRCLASQHGPCGVSPALRRLAVALVTTSTLLDRFPLSLVATCMATKAGLLTYGTDPELRQQQVQVAQELEHNGFDLILLNTCPSFDLDLCIRQVVHCLAAGNRPTSTA